MLNEPAVFSATSETDPRLRVQHGPDTYPSIPLLSGVAHRQLSFHGSILVGLVPIELVFWYHSSTEYPVGPLAVNSVATRCFDRCWLYHTCWGHIQLGRPFWYMDGAREDESAGGSGHRKEGPTYNHRNHVCMIMTIKWVG